MRVLLDTNILMTYLSGREDTYAAECEQIVQMCSDEAIEGVIAFHSLSTIWYLTRKAPEDLRRGYIKQICVLFSIAGADKEAVLKAIENRDFRDFEDARKNVDHKCDTRKITERERDFGRIKKLYVKNTVSSEL